MKKKFLKTFAVIASVCTLVACGGGGGSAGTNAFVPAPAASSASGVTATSAVIGLALSTNTVTAATPATVTATVYDGNGVPVSGKVVTFSTVNGLGAFSSTTALTNLSGVATVALYPANNTTSGADTVKATISVNGSPVEATQGFQLTATAVTISSFTSDVLAPSALSAYGQANLTVSVAGAATGTPISVTLNSLCATKGKAILTPATAVTTNGVVNFTYKDQGCGATDAADSLQATVVGSSTTAALNLNLSSPAVSSITFTSASPQTIYLKGSGFTENSVVTFQVKDLGGNPLPNRSVVLDATTLTGGLTIDGAAVPVTKQSDSSGNVSVQINSGTVPTPVRVRATLGSIATVSSNLSIAVGLPSQQFFSLSQGKHNIEGYDHDGVANTYTIIASDRLGNPVPAGTSVNFVSGEGGQIEGSKQITLTNGSASTTANFVSSAPRPVDGRITVVAYALGEETFIDNNGNNVYDAGEAFQDLGDVYIDRAYDGTFNSITDQFISLSLSGTSACASVNPALDPNNLLGGLVNIPSRPLTCDGVWGRAYVRGAIETVLSTSTAGPLWLALPQGALLDSGCAVRNLKIDNLGATNNFKVVGDGGVYGAPAQGGLQVYASDANPVRLNPVAAGTTVTALTTNGLSATITGGSPVVSTTEAPGVSLTYEFTAPATSGTLTLVFTSPLGVSKAVPINIRTGASTAGVCAL